MNEMTEEKKYRKSTLTRSRILASALELMKTEGYQGTTIRAICKKAGVSPAAFYCYFTSKSDLLEDIYQDSDDYFGRELPLILVQENFLDQVVIYVKAYAQLNLETGLDMMRVLFNPENIWFSRNRPMQKTLFGILKVGKGKGFFAPETDCQELVGEVFLILRGVCYDWCIHDGDYDIEARMLRMTGYYLLGICMLPEEMGHIRERFFQPES